MMSKLRTLPVGLYLMAMLTVGGCTHMTRETRPPHIQLVGMQLQDVQLFEQRYLLQIRLENQNDFDLNIQGFDFNVEINDEPFAHGLSNEEVSVPGFGDAITDISVSSNIMSLMRQLDAVSDRVKYHVSGRVKLEGVPIAVPFETEGELNLKTGSEHTSL